MKEQYIDMIFFLTHSWILEKDNKPFHQLSPIALKHNNNNNNR